MCLKQYKCAELVTKYFLNEPQYVKCTYISITLQVFPVFDISPGPYTDQTQSVGDAVVVPQEGLSLTDRIPDRPHHPDV